MNRLLTAKAWQLIIVVVVIPFILFAIIQIGYVTYLAKQNRIVPISDGLSWDTIFTFVWLFLILLLPFLWQYQVGTKMTRKLANGRAYSDSKFRFAFFGPAGIIILLFGVSIVQEIDADGFSVSESRVQGLLFVFFLITYLIGFYFRYRQMGKTLHWVDKASGHRPRGNTVNLLLSLFWWVGIWFLQPRVRAAWKSLQERNLEDHFIEK